MTASKSRLVVLAYPDTDMEMPGTYALPLSVLAVATALFEDYEVAIYDQRTDDDAKLERLLARNPIAVGVSSMTGTQILHGLKISEKAKARGIPTIWGNWHATLLPQQTVAHPLVDYVVTNEGEGAIAELVGELAEKGYSEKKIWHGMVADWGKFPPVPYHLVDCEKYLFNAQYPRARTLPFTFSRGCPFSCAYCATGNMVRKWRPLSVDRSVEVMMGLVNRYDLDLIKFTDENISTNKKVFGPLADAIGGQFGWLIQTRMDCLNRLDIHQLERNGLRLVASGLESGSPRILEKIKKKETVEQYIDVNRRLATTNIRASYNFMMAFPGETYEEIMQTVDVGLRMIDDNPNAFFNPYYTFVPYPGCELADEFTDQLPKSLAEWAKFDRFNAQTTAGEAFRFELSNIAFSSKFVGRRFISKFPGNDKVADFTDRLTYEWRRHNFSSEIWHSYREENAELMDELFGKYAVDGIINARQKKTISDYSMQKMAETKEPDGVLPTDHIEAGRPAKTGREAHFQNVGASDF